MCSDVVWGGFEVVWGVSTVSDEIRLIFFFSFTSHK